MTFFFLTFAMAIISSLKYLTMNIITMFVITCVSLCCFIDKVEDPYEEQACVYMMVCLYDGFTAQSTHLGHVEVGQFT